MAGPDQAGAKLDGVNALATSAGGMSPLIRTTLDVALPAGISFYTFQSMGYSIDVCRRDTCACRSFLEFASFVSLFPHLSRHCNQRVVRELVSGCAPLAGDVLRATVSRQVLAN